MTTYYKATRPDGTDFYSGTVDYAGALETGKPIRRKPVPEYGFECCSDTVYHASDTPSETLIGGSWPCRLFEVTGRKVAQEGHKFGFRSLRVVAEVPAWMALGPNGEAVAALIEQARTITPEQATRLAAAWAAARAAARDAARDAAEYAARDAARDAAEYAAWAAARDAAEYAAWAAARDAAEYAARVAARVAARDAAEYAARVAARALVVRDLISAEHFNTLYGPWVEVMGA